MRDNKAQDKIFLKAKTNCLRVCFEEDDIMAIKIGFFLKKSKNHIKKPCFCGFLILYYEYWVLQKIQYLLFFFGASLENAFNIPQGLTFNTWLGVPNAT